MEATSNLNNEIESLKSKLTGNMLEDMEIRDQIHNLEMKKNGVKPEDSHFDCIKVFFFELVYQTIYIV